MVFVRPSILFVDDDPNVLDAVRRSLHSYALRWDLRYETDPRTALEHVNVAPPRVVISDLDMPHLNGLDLIGKMRATSPDTAYILLTGTGDFTSALEAINRAEVFRFYTKPCPAERLVLAIETALEQQDARKGAVGPETEAGQKDPMMQLVLARSALELMAPSVLVLEANGRLTYANKSAGNLLADRDGILIDGSDICRAASIENTNRMREAIAELSSSTVRHPLFLSLPRPSMKRDLALVLMPLDETSPDGKNMVAVLITDPEVSTAPDPVSLVKIFNLTRSEAIIARSIAQGVGLENAAAACGVTLSSARTYLKRIFSKTGTNSQAELVKLILSSSAALVKEAC